MRSSPAHFDLLCRGRFGGIGLPWDTSDRALAFCTLHSAGTSRSLPGRRELICEKRFVMRGKIATRYSEVYDDVILGSATNLPVQRIRSRFPKRIAVHVLHRPLQDLRIE